MIASSPEVATSVLELAMDYMPSMDRSALASVLGSVCRRQPVAFLSCALRQGTGFKRFALIGLAFRGLMSV